LEGSAGSAPNLLARFPLDANARGAKKFIEHPFHTSGKRKQLSIYGPGNNKGSQWSERNREPFVRWCSIVDLCPRAQSRRWYR
jgi:hypothetical protein